MQCTVSGQEICCGGIAIQSEVSHSIHSSGRVLLISVPEVSNIGKSMNRYLFKDREFVIFPEETVDAVRNYWSMDIPSGEWLEDLFSLFRVPVNEKFIKDERVLEVMERLESLEETEYRLADLAESLQLSEGRMSRLFHSEVGVTLKNYVLLLKLSKTFSYMLEGQNLTNACINAGFSGSAHFAYALHKWLGFTGRELKYYLDAVNYL